MLFSSCADSLSGNDDEEKRLFSQISAGMTTNQVGSILGQPDAISIDLSNGHSTYHYFTKNKSGMRSEMPIVIFDSMGRVVFATYGDGG